MNSTLVEVRKKFINTKAAINEQLNINFIQDNQLTEKIKNSHDYNQVINFILSKPHIRELIEDYKNTYVKSFIDFPTQVIFSKFIRRLIEGNYFDIRHIDLTLTKESISKNIESDFKNIILNNPQILNALKVEESYLQLISESNTLFKTNKESDCYQAINSWFEESEIYPKKINQDSFFAVQAFHSGDSITLELLSRNQYQRAIWRLEELGQKTTSLSLEKWLTENVLANDNAEKIDFLGGGFTTSKLIRYPNQIKGVYKPKPWEIPHPHTNHLQRLKDSIVSDYKKEIAAYKIDRLIQLNHVPLTKLVILSDGIGSLQYFIGNATLAHYLNEVLLNSPTQSDKWTKPFGRTVLPSYIKFFDWLIDNHDRNIDNYLFLDNGRPVLIDHGWTFITPFFISPTKRTIESILPTRPIYEAVVQLNQNPKIIDQELSHLLSVKNLSLFKKRIGFFVQYIEDPAHKSDRDIIFHQK